ncbi:methyl-accepting chemotaxis protein [Geomobilimonas luticola]|uniref:GAF domain-containing protein n=1 Tax=Geomobilimonas luticola TaxID=1114878 RepID=A0ABS5SBZ6_9BACT|nr:methyl-accepting chemotaxis protein [Geomobilimonas luticola]MBT0652900.1 GAF domain-containing protein [Geomobilimonas luticola]
MQLHTTSKNRSIIYALLGFILGIGAPFAWTVIRLILFPDPAQALWQQIFSDVTRSSYNIALYTYMGVGTACVMSFLGFFIGRASDQLHERAIEMDGLHREVASQKEVFENRYKVLDNNIKNFHQISSRIQKSINVEEVLSLCAEGLHDVLGYERVNILMADEGRTSLHFVTATASEGFDTTGVTVPLDERIGIIFKCFNDKRLYLVEDISTYPKDYQLQPPFDSIRPLRSRNFVLCPIVVKGQSVGVFGIDNKFSHRSLNDTDVDTIKLFADQAASAITRINLLGAIDTLTGELGNTFSGLLKNREVYSRNVQNLISAVTSLADTTAHIASASESVLSSVDETSSAVGEISVAIEQVSRNLDALSEAVDKSVSAMEEISATLKNVETTTAVSHQMASHVKSQADRGMVVVDETITALADIQTSVDLSYSGIKRLSEKSSRIDSIVNVINDITKRTNLLALNASIIAAQAGEYGKSFGVVADEIRNLSLQTGQSTGEITGIIEEIMSESRTAAGSVSVTKELVQKGVILGRQTGDALRVILESSSRSMDMTEEIKIATEEQGKSVRLVTQSMEDVSTMTSQIFNASKEQANATKSIVRAIDSIKELTEEMVGATGRQVEDGTSIKVAVDEVGEMVIGLFDDLEKRRGESRAVVDELEMIKGNAV